MDIVHDQFPVERGASRYEDGFITAASLALAGFSLVIIAVIYDAKWLAFAAGGESAGGFAVFYFMLLRRGLGRRPPRDYSD